MKTITIHIAKFLPAIIMAVRQSFFSKKRTEKPVVVKPKNKAIDTNFGALSDKALIARAKKIEHTMLTNSYFEKEQQMCLKTNVLLVEFEKESRSYASTSNEQTYRAVRRSRMQLTRHLHFVTSFVKRKTDEDVEHAKEIIDGAGFKIRRN